jgi:hypothetical protein
VDDRSADREEIKAVRRSHIRVADQATAANLHPDSARIRLDNSLNDVLSLKRRGRPSRRGDVTASGVLFIGSNIAPLDVKARGTQFRS